MKKLKKFERTMLAWIMENPRQYRAMVTVGFAISVAVQVHGFTREGTWLKVVSVVLIVMLLTIYAALVFLWRRMDLLDELRRLVTDHTDDVKLGDVAWMWGHRVGTKTVRDVVRWLETHDVSRTPVDDMPQPVRILTHVLTQAL